MDLGIATASNGVQPAQLQLKQPNRSNADLKWILILYGGLCTNIILIGISTQGRKVWWLLSCFHVLWGAIISQVQTNKDISTPHKVQHCFVKFRPHLKPSCILHSSSNLHGWWNRSSRPSDCWTNQCLFYGAWKASRCDLRGTKFQKFTVLKVDNQDLGRQVSLIARLKHMKQTMELLCKANGATLHYFLPSFVILHFVRPLKSLLYCR